MLLTYVKPASNPLQAANGDDADAFTNLSISNSASWSPHFTFDDGVHLGGPAATFEVQFSNRLFSTSTPDNSPDLSAFSVKVDGSAATLTRFLLTNRNNGMGNLLFQMQSAITAGQTVSVSYTRPVATLNMLVDDTDNRKASPELR